MKHKRSSLFLMSLVAAGLLAGCATEPVTPVTATYDPATGLRADLMENELPGPESPRELVWLNASRFAKDFKTYSYYLEVRYMATDQVGLLKIAPGASLSLNVDGQTVRYSGIGGVPSKATEHKGVVRETAVYEVTVEQLRQIARAQSVQVSVKGENGLVERAFGPENFERFKKFVVTAVGL